MCGIAQQRDTTVGAGLEWVLVTQTRDGGVFDGAPHTVAGIDGAVRTL